MDLDDQDLNEIAANLDVKEHPAVLIFRNGKVVAFVQGFETRRVAELFEKVGGIEEEDDW